jgi:predicted O-methyltransferase YrrM
MREEEMGELYRCGRSLPKVNPVIVEIGSWLGRSSVVLAASIKDCIDPVLYCVDPWDASGNWIYDASLKNLGIPKSDLFSTFWSHIEKAGLQGVVQPCPGTSEHWANLLRHTPIDMLFIDGDHSEEAVTKDLSLWIPMLKPGGILAMHDMFLPAFAEQHADAGKLGYEAGPFAAFQKVITPQQEKWEAEAKVTWSLLTLKKKESA